MKKTLITILLIVLSISAMAQTRARTGLSVGDHRVAGTNIKVIDSAVVINSKLYFFINGDTTGVGVLAEDIVDLFTVAMKLYPDTAIVTAAVFRPNLTHLNTYIRVNRASQVIVYLPPDTTVNFPIGSTLNFKMDNAGIVTFKGSNSRIEAKKDSATINFKGGWATAIKRAANQWDLLGDLTD